MLTRRQLLALIPAVPLLSACHEQPAPPEPRVLPDQTAIVMKPRSPGMTTLAMDTAFWMSDEGVYVKKPRTRWVKISEAL